MKQLTDKEIVKALKCCTTKDMSCKDCPAFTTVNRSNCKKYFKAAVELINRQKAEIDRLNALIETRHKIFETKCSELEIAKTEAYKEFAERFIEEASIKEVIYSGAVISQKYIINKKNFEKLLKEMVGEK